jgi:leucine-zipper of insertion element IS481
MREIRVAEQGYQAALAVISEGRAVMEVASQWGVGGRTVHRWLARYGGAWLEGLPDRSQPSYQLCFAHLSPSAWPVQHGRRHPYCLAPTQSQPRGRNAFGLRGVEAS